MTFEEFLVKAAKDYARNAGWARLGQQYMNTLWEIKPALYLYVSRRKHRQTDPFYNDNLLPQFLAELAKLWDEPWTDLKTQLEIDEFFKRRDQGHS